MRTAITAVLAFVLLIACHSVAAKAPDYCATEMRAKARGVVLVLGDSLSAGYGMNAAQAWPALANSDLAQRSVCVINASVSGETSAGGLARLPALLKRHKPSVVVIALGANDGLRGLDPAQLAQNLSTMAQQSKNAAAKVLIVGIRLPPNYGLDYNVAFEASFRDAAKAEKTGLLEFLLAPIALNDAAFQADRLHPTAVVQPAIWQHVKPAVLAVLATDSKSKH